MDDLLVIICLLFLIDFFPSGKFSVEVKNQNKDLNKLNKKKKNEKK